MSKEAILKATDLGKEYGELCVLKDVSMTMERGEFIAIVGKSGSGKTTLLSLVSGLERPTNGRVVLNKQGHYRYIGE